MGDISPAIPVGFGWLCPAVDSYAGWMDVVPETDLSAPRKRHHTAKRIYDQVDPRRTSCSP